MELLKSEEKLKVREFAANVLRVHDVKGEVHGLLKLLNLEKEDSVLHYLASVLASTQDPLAVQALAGRLRTAQSSPLRTAFASALCETRSPAAVHQVLEFYKAEPDERVRKRIIQKLGFHAGEWKEVYHAMLAHLKGEKEPAVISEILSYLQSCERFGSSARAEEIGFLLRLLRERKEYGIRKSASEVLLRWFPDRPNVRIAMEEFKKVPEPTRAGSKRQSPELDQEF